MPEGEDGRGWRGHGEGESLGELGGVYSKDASDLPEYFRQYVKTTM